MSGDAATREQSTIPEMVVGRSEKSLCSDHLQDFSYVCLWS